MAAASAQGPSEWDEDPAWSRPDPMTAEEREAWLDRLCQLDDDPCDGPQEYWDPQSCAPPPGQDELTPAELAGAAEAAAGAGRLWAGVPGRVGQPGGRVRCRDGVGRDAGLSPAGGGGRCRGRRRR